MLTLLVNIISGASSGPSDSGLMVGFRTAFFSFRLRTRPSSGRGRHEGRDRPNKVWYRFTASQRNRQSWEVPRDKTNVYS